MQNLFGRTAIYTDELNITAANIVAVLDKALSVHAQNQSQIDYLWNYYCGNTPIWQKTKEVRENINHKIAVNRANEIVTFKRGYGFGEPIQYIRRGKDETLTDDIDALNECMFQTNKQSEDSNLAEWLYVAGLGLRMVLPTSSLPYGDEEVPFTIFTLDPRYNFVVKYNGLGTPVVMSVKTVEKEDNSRVHCCYTRTHYYEIQDGIIRKIQPHALGDVPVFEYPANQAMLGAFEIVLPLLDAISEIESNRLDDVEQFVNSFLALLGGSIDDETAKKLNEYKMLCLPDGVDAKYLSVAMQQNDTQVLVDDLYDAVLTICGIPNRNGGSSTSDTGSAVIMRDGWETAEAQMKSVEQEFKKSEKRFLKMVLRIMRDTVGTNLKVADIEIKFSRRNYDNLLSKVQALTTMLDNPKIHPELAFTHSGLFLDPESAYLQSKLYWEEQQKLEEQETEKYLKSLRDDNGEEPVQQDGQNDSVSE